MLVKLVMKRSRSIVVQLSYGSKPVLQRQPTLGEKRGEKVTGRWLWDDIGLFACYQGVKQQVVDDAAPSTAAPTPIERLIIKKRWSWSQAVLADTGSY